MKEGSKQEFIPYKFPYERPPQKEKRSFHESYNENTVGMKEVESKIFQANYVKT